MDKKEYSVSEILEVLYGKDISLSDLSFIEDIKIRIHLIEPFYTFFEQEIPYSKMDRSFLVNRKEFDQLYFILFRLLEIIVSLLETDEVQEYENEINTIFDELFYKNYLEEFGSEPSFNDKVKYICDALTSMITLIDIYFNIPIYINHIFYSRKYIIDYLNMSFQDIYVTLNHFNFAVLPTKYTLDLIKKQEKIFESTWYSVYFNYDINNLRIEKIV